MSIQTVLKYDCGQEIRQVRYSCFMLDNCCVISLSSTQRVTGPDTYCINKSSILSRWKNSKPTCISHQHLSIHNYPQQPASLYPDYLLQYRCWLYPLQGNNLTTYSCWKLEFFHLYWLASNFCFLPGVQRLPLNLCGLTLKKYLYYLTHFFIYLLRFLRVRNYSL